MKADVGDRFLVLDNASSYFYLIISGRLFSQVFQRISTGPWRSFSFSFWLVAGRSSFVSSWVVVCSRADTLECHSSISKFTSLKMDCDVCFRCCAPARFYRRWLSRPRRGFFWPLLILLGKCARFFKFWSITPPSKNEEVNKPNSARVDRRVSTCLVTRSLS